MENAIGIEAARARLGDIAEHARTTGQITALTRHGRTIAVIGPAEAVKPRSGIRVHVLFPEGAHMEDQALEVPAVPRKGDPFEWTDEHGAESFWRVSDVVWSADKNGISMIGIEVEPNDPWANQDQGGKTA